MNEAVTNDLIDGLRNSSRTVRGQAADKLAAMGPAARTAMPALLGALADRSPGVRLRAMSALAAIAPLDPLVFASLMHTLKEGNRKVRKHARRVLTNVGPSVASFLVPALASSDDRIIDKVLRRFEPEAVFCLRAALKSPDADLRRAGVGALARRGEPAQPFLREALQDPEVSVRATVHAWLVRTGRPVAETAEALSEAAVVPNPDIRRLASNALAELGPVSIPAIVRYLEHGEPAVRKASAVALHHVLRHKYGLRHERRYDWYREDDPRPLSREQSSCLLKLLHDDNSEVRLEAARVLEFIGTEARELVPALAVLLEAGAPDEIMHVLHSLPFWSYDFDAATSLAAVPQLVDVLKTSARLEIEDPVFPMVAAGVFSGQPTKPTRLRQLRKVLVDVERLGDIPRDDREHMFLAMILHDNQVAECLKERAAYMFADRAVKTIEPINGVLEELFELFEKGNESLRNLAVNLVRKMGPNAVHSVPKILELLDGIPSGKVRDNLISALCEIGPSATPLAEKVARKLADLVREGYPGPLVGKALARIGPPAAIAVSAIIDMFPSNSTVSVIPVA